MAVCLLAGLAACGPSTKPIYFISPAGQSEGQFTRDLASVAASAGLTATAGRAPSSEGRALYVLEAKGRWLRLWAQNVAACGREGDRMPDPNQYMMYLQPTAPWAGPPSENKLARELMEGLVKRGYRFGDQESACATLSNGS